MPKPITLPFIIDNANTITISALKKWGYFEPNSQKYGSLKWSTNGIKTSSILIIVKMTNTNGVLTLKYNCEEKKYNYDIQVISRTSNLGKGNLFFFICPFTLKVCRKLHLYNEYFIHRSAISGGMYSKQIQTKKWRQIEKVYGNYFDKEKYIDILYSKHFKKYYNGKPTKKYLKMIEKINDANRFSANDIERLIAFGTI